MKKHLRAGAVAGLSVALFGAMLAGPAPAVAAGKGKPKTETVKFNCKVRTLEDKHGITEFKGCKKNGKYQVSIRTKDTKLDGWPSRAWVDRRGIKVVGAVADGKGKWSPWMTTGWTTDAGPYVAHA
ncbi:hypothetical protein ACFY9H_30545 [Streptomyces bacillaris]|uniref:Secreted protein n=1 Tax=Streptomyces cavourensis TaxID=67258 RepID=A0AAD0Q8E3_9ACTN|nr:MULTISPECIES: hypothetical protein [Streptomyces]NUW21516.1 hypothetical protein [Streptomyces roseoviolaceus]ATY98387.1 hypothetical protein CVT27_25130 [Streptomyces cavourensis]AXI74235.1 hypothetical protein DTW94_25365 [Streptomyces cavourensis]MBH0246549.1 hypothetical protein [Streptomyces cavourensis]NUV40703.1 hypothetical protein [Streptomyces sp. CAI-24]